MIRFENQGTYTYLVYEVEENDVIDNVSLNMLIKNKIPGLANTLFTQMDTNRYIKYNVSSKVTAKQFMAGVVNRKKLLSFFKGIIDGYMSIDDYMLSTDQIVMDLDYIFTDVSTGDTYLICIPLQNRSFSNEDMPSFLKKVMFSTNFDQNENCDHVAKIINYLNSSSSFSLESFRNLLKEIEGGTGAAQHAAPQPSPAKLTKSPVPAQPVMPKPVQPAVQPPVQPPVQQPKRPMVRSMLGMQASLAGGQILIGRSSSDCALVFQEGTPGVSGRRMAFSRSVFKCGFCMAFSFA